MSKKCVVIGSGLGGTLVANALSHNQDVTVLEVGPKDSIRYPAVAFPNRKLAGIDTFCLGSGGTTNLWHNGLIPMRQSDIFDPAFQAVLNDAQRYTDQAASQLFFNGASYTRTFAKLLGEVRQLGNRIADFPDDVDCLIYPTTHSPLVLSHKVKAFYDVHSVDFALKGKQLSTISFCSNGTRSVIHADFVIIAAGAFGSPGILQTILRTAGDLSTSIGGGFIDHPMGFVGKFRFPKETAKLVKTFALMPRNGYRSRNIIRLKSECGQYTGGAFFRPSVTLGNNLSIYKYKSLLGASKGIKRVRNALSPKLFHPDIISEITSHLFDTPIPTRTYSVLFMGEQKRGLNSVSNDGGDLTIDWSISDDELRIYSAMIRKLADSLQSAAEKSEVLENVDSNWLWSGAHHSGTLALGDGPDNLIDPNLKVTALDNVFVCDGSVIPEHSYANTGLTIGQLALRLAARIMEIE